MQQSAVRQIAAGVFAACLFTGFATAGDWTHWRGPTQDGVSYDKNLPDKFSLDPGNPNSNLIWTAPYGCRSTPVVMNGRVYIFNSGGSGLSECERVVCLDAQSGSVIKEDRFNIFHTDVVSNRLGWTSPVGDAETGYVYIHGTQGFMRCYDKDLNLVWDHNLAEEYGRVSGYGGRSVSPTLDSGLVIVGMINGSWGDYARSANRFVAFDKKNGKVVWWCVLPEAMHGTYYSNPVVAVINGERLLITGGADGGVHAIQVRTGKLVWSHHFGAKTINCSPVVDGNLVYCSHGEENEDTNQQGRIVCVDGSQVENGKPKLVWEVVGTKFGYTSPVVHDGVLYICTDTARIHRYDAKTGKPIGKPYAYGRLARGSPVWADGKIFVFDVNGEFHILKPTETSFKEIYTQRFKPANGVGFVETNGSPAVVDGRLYFGTLEAFYCIGTKDAQAGSPPAAAKEPAVPGPVAQVAIFPADVVLTPGESAEFELRAFDANGAKLDTIPDGKWQITTPPKQPNGRQPPPLAGELVDTSKGHAKLTVAKNMPGQQGYVDFISGTMLGRVRVRVAPKMPYKMDFDKVPISATPGGWVNTMGKFDVVRKGDQIVLRKTATSSIPTLARANAFIGQPNWKDYTIQADVSGQEVRNCVADIGLVNCRYQLLLDGKQDPDDHKRRLRITCWETKPRINHSVVFDWQPDIWYTMKFRVDVENDKALVRGKVWERGKPEPEQWTIEFTDPMPNREGAPALYSYVSNVLDKVAGSEAYFDNVLITPNKR
jgi:outer membrane protein assembly factor BamB